MGWFFRSWWNRPVHTNGKIKAKALLSPVVIIPTVDPSSKPELIMCLVRWQLTSGI